MLWNGVTYYCPYRENGEVLVVVEAKETATDVRLAEAQLTYYVTEIYGQWSALAGVAVREDVLRAIFVTLNFSRMTLCNPSIRGR